MMLEFIHPQDGDRDGRNYKKGRDDMVEVLIWVALFIVVVLGTGIFVLILEAMAGNVKTPMWWQRRRALKNLVRIRWHSDGTKYLENQLDKKIYDLEYRIHLIEMRKREKKK